MSVCLPLSSSLPLSLPFFLSFLLSLSLESRLALILQSTGLSFLSVCKSVFQAPRFFPSNIVTLWFLTSVSISWKISYSGNICFIFSYLLQLIIKKIMVMIRYLNIHKWEWFRWGAHIRYDIVRHVPPCAPVPGGVLSVVTRQGLYLVLCLTCSWAYLPWDTFGLAVPGREALASMHCLCLCKPLAFTVLIHRLSKQLNP